MTGGTGTCTSTATWAADSNYSGATLNQTTTALKASATIVVTPYSATYDGAAHTATGTATGVGGADLSAQLNLTGTTHTTAGTYNGDAWSFAGGANYNDASGTVNDTIARATASVLLSNLTQSYDGTPRSATVTTVPSGLAVIVTYDGSPTAPTAVGSYSVVATVSDANYQGSATGTLLIQDTTAPDTTITSGPTSPTSATDASFTFSGSDNVTPAASLTFQCSLDSASATACTSPAPYSGLSAGNHTFTAAAIDAAGNIDASPASFSWTIDLTAPDVTINSMPPNPTNQQSATFGFQRRRTDARSNASSTAAALRACTSTTVLPTDLCRRAATRFDVRAMDQAGNPMHPGQLHLGGGPDGSRTRRLTRSLRPSPTATAASFTFHGSEGGSFQCKLDWQAFGACTSASSTDLLRPGAGPAHLLRRRDRHGRQHRKPGQLQLDDRHDGSGHDDHGRARTNGSTTSSTSASFSFTGSDNISLPADLTFECQARRGSFSPCTSPASYSSLSAGSHTFSGQSHGPGRQHRCSLPTAAPGRWTRRRRTRRSTRRRPTRRNQTTATFTFHSSRRPARPSSVELDGASFASCAVRLPTAA